MPYGELTLEQARTLADNQFICIHWPRLYRRLCWLKKSLERAGHPVLIPIAAGVLDHLKMLMEKEQAIRIELPPDDLFDRMMSARLYFALLADVRQKKTRQVQTRGIRLSL